jgi:hypothetical protein
MKPRILFLPLAGVLVLGGCGETNQQVIDRYKPRMEAVGVRLKAIHGRLPATLAPLEAPRTRATRRSWPRSSCSTSTRRPPSS